MTVAAAPRLTGGALASVVFHGGLIATFLVLRPAPAPPSPPIYRVQLLAAPPGERAIGVVQPEPAAPTPEAPPPAAKTATPRPKAPPTKAKATPAPKVATATPPPKPADEPKPATPAPTAAGGPTGGRGADVSNLDTGGIEFPYP